MDDFQIKQVESDDPEKVTYLIKLPEEFCNPIFLDIFRQRMIQKIAYEFQSLILKGVKTDGRD